MRHPSSGRAAPFALLCALMWCAACGSPAGDTTPRASIAVRVVQPSAEAGAPIELEYQLAVRPNAPPLPSDTWVFVHLLDESGMLLWTDDHVPPSPSSSWGTKPPTYRRTMFVPRIPYTGRVRVQAGLFSLADGTRVALAGTDRGGHAYDVASFDVRPASNAVFVSFGDGWHGAERDPKDAAREWRWSMGDATLSFRRPPGDAVLWLELDQPVAAVGVQRIDVRVGPTVIAAVPVPPGERRAARVPLAASQFGPAPTVDLRLHVEPTFVPAKMPNMTSSDTRELGVRVFNVHVGLP
jgi:hypothetical protein